MMIILITIISVTIIWQFLVPFVKNNLNRGTECVPYSTYFSFEEEIQGINNIERYNCNVGNKTGAAIRAANTNAETEDKIFGFEIRFIGDNNIIQNVIVNSSSKSYCGEGGLWILGKECRTNMEIPQSGSVKTYVFNKTGEKYNYAEVYPILKNGRVCERSDRIKLVECSPELVIR